VKQDEFESQLLKMWSTTRVPLTKANVMGFTGAPREKVLRWLDAMTTEGLLDIDSDNDGEMLWRVRGAERPKVGATTLGDLHTLARLEREIDSEMPNKSRVLALREKNASRALSHWDKPSEIERHDGKERKSIVASGLLSFFFGPFGLLYAAPLREALPAIAIWSVVATLVPSAVGLLHPVTAVLGLLYALRYNRLGHRAGVFSGSGDTEKQLEDGKKFEDRFRRKDR